MKLESITLRNFRCYDAVTLELHPQLTVLVADNGGGKSTFLDGIRIGLWPYIRGFDLATNYIAISGSCETIKQSDIRVLEVDDRMARQLPTDINITANYGEGIKTWQRRLESEAINSPTLDNSTTQALTDYAKAQQTLARDLHNPKPIDLPVLGYYGTVRLWQAGVFEQLKATNPPNAGEVSESTRTFAYAHCLDLGSNVSHENFKRWFRKVCFKVVQARIKNTNQQPIKPHLLAPVLVIQQAVDTLLEALGWHTLEYDFNNLEKPELVLHHPKQGQLAIDQLSDGIQNIVVMVADIAYRCTLLNSHLGVEAAQKSQGVVMIDEVDMHLHPSWQQNIIAGLLKAFPNIQFIVTTHSPQVLSTVKRESIRVLGVNAQGKAVASTPLAFSYGEPSNDVLQAIMQVDPQPPVPEKNKLERLTALVEQGLYDQEEALKLSSELQTLLNEHHPQLTKIERSIRRQKALRP